MFCSFLTFLIIILIKKLLDISENLLVSFKRLLILGNDFVIPMDNDATQMDDDQLYRNYE